MSRALSPPRIQDTVMKSCVARSELREESRDMAGPIFPTWGGRISTAQVSYDLDFWIFRTFCGISQKGIIVGGKSWSKNYRENTSPAAHFCQNFFAEEIFEL